MIYELKKKAARGVLWNMIEQFAVQGIKFILGIILARLLNPSDFGLIGMIIVFFDLANVFVESGLGIAYIQKPNVTDEDANTVFFTNLFASILIFVLLWFVAPFVASFYKQPILKNLMRVMAVVVIVNAFGIIQLAQIKRMVNFKRKMKVTMFSAIVSGLIGIYSAIRGLGAWSLVAQQLSNQILVTVIYSFINKWKPSLRYSIESLRTMLSVGSWELFSGLVETFFSNIYILTIGKFFQPTNLGYYSKAHQLQSLLSNQLSGSIGYVAFPILSRLQKDKSNLEKAIQSFIQYSFLLTVPCMAITIVVAEPFVKIFLTDKWLSMVPYLQLLCLTGFLYPMHVVNLQILTAIGRTKLSFKLSIIKGLLRIVNIVITYRWGLIYVIYGELVLSIISLILNTYYTGKLIHYGLKKQMKDVKNIVIGGSVSLIVIFPISGRIQNEWIRFFGGAVLTFIIFLVCEILINRKLMIKSWKMKDTIFKN